MTDFSTGPPIYKWYEDIQMAQRIMNWIVVTILVFSNIAVLYVLKFKLTVWGYFTLILHLTVSCVRLFTPSFTDSFN